METTGQARKAILKISTERTTRQIQYQMETISDFSRGHALRAHNQNRTSPTKNRHLPKEFVPSQQFVQRLSDSKQHIELAFVQEISKYKGLICDLQIQIQSLTKQRMIQDVQHKNSQQQLVSINQIYKSQIKIKDDQRNEALGRLSGKFNQELLNQDKRHQQEVTSLCGQIENLKIQILKKDQIIVSIKSDLKNSQDQFASSQLSIQELQNHLRLSQDQLKHIQICTQQEQETHRKGFQEITNRFAQKLQKLEQVKQQEKKGSQKEKSRLRQISDKQKENLAQYYQNSMTALYKSLAERIQELLAIIRVNEGQLTLYEIRLQESCREKQLLLQEVSRLLKFV